MAVRAAHYYDVFAHVGPSCPNYVPDVQLVQFFLFTMTSANAWNVPAVLMPFIPPGVTGQSALYPHTGIYTPELSQWIRAFQAAANDQGFGPLIVDGKVNPANKLWGRRNVSSHWYTILAMNEVLIRANKPRFLDLPNDASLPPQLRSDLQGFVLYSYP